MTPNLISLIKKMFGLLFVYSLLRLIFFAMNYDIFHSITAKEFLITYLVGIRFDLMTLAIINAPIILFNLIPFSFLRKYKVQKISNIIFYLLNLVAIIPTCVDLAFFRFNMKRMSTDIFALLDVIPKLLGQFFFDFWYIFVLFIVFSIILALFLTKTTKEIKKVSLPKIILSNFLLLIVFAIAFRGGVQRKPLRPLTAANFVNINHTSLALNSTFTLIKSFSKRRLKTFNFYKKNVLKSNFTAKKEHAFSINPNMSKQNVMLIVLESFSKEFVGYYNNKNKITPFLDSLIPTCTSFENSFANGRRSSEALVALLSSIPNLMDDPYLHSNYANSKVNGLGLLLKKIGYKSYFFNGSNKETLGWSDYIKKMGFTQHFSREDYNNEADYDGNWGIYDDKMLSYFANHQVHNNGPFFSMLFALSSHHPYRVPSYYPRNIIKHKFKNSVSYVDWSLERFFQQAKQQTWYKNTVFIITGDHSPGAHKVESTIQSKDLKNRFFKNKVGIYSIPILICGESIKPAVKKQVAQHVDIMPTVLSLTNFNNRFYSYGKSLVSNSDGYALQYSNGIYQVIDEDFILFFNGSKNIGLYEYKTDILLERNLIKDLKYQDVLLRHERQVKSIIQTFTHDLINNKVYYE